ncbi:MAG: hypothetical protein LBG83_08950 [Oscillospiraceae bacterium]|jgi:hypothetical protein|nr:hypothetical protein [Oscillospiraceae bacterium]
MRKLFALVLAVLMTLGVCTLGAAAEPTAAPEAAALTMTVKPEIMEYFEGDDVIVVADVQGYAEGEIEFAWTQPVPYTDPAGTDGSVPGSVTINPDQTPPPISGERRFISTYSRMTIPQALEGLYTFTVTAADSLDGGNNVTKTITVLVGPASQKRTHEDLSIYVSELPDKVTIYRRGATNDYFTSWTKNGIIWKVDDNRIFTIDEKTGEMKFNRPGTIFAFGRVHVYAIDAETNVVLKSVYVTVTWKWYLWPVVFILQGWLWL